MRRHQRLTVPVGAVIVVVAAAIAGTAGATTGPAPHTLVNVSISDKTIKLSKNKTADVTFVDFYLHNVGKRTHTMIIGRQESVVVRPGQRVHFYVGFPVYGWYPYHVGLHGTAKMKGRFHIESPQPPD